MVIVMAFVSDCSSSSESITYGLIVMVSIVAIVTVYKSETQLKPSTLKPKSLSDWKVPGFLRFVLGGQLPWFWGRVCRAGTHALTLAS